MLLLDALYINNSGGKILLDILIKELHQSKAAVFYLLDSRCIGAYPFLPEENVIYLNASLKNRHQFYTSNKNRFSKIFCFANIPPSVKLKVPVYTYFHNLLFLEQPDNYPFKEKISKKIKGQLIKLLKANTDYFIVQSENVKNILVKKLSLSQEKCLVIPFYRELKSTIPFTDKKKEFVYISNGNSHKNHINLLEAWEILNEVYGLNIPIHLTITQNYTNLLEKIELLKEKGLQIYNHEFIDVKFLYDQYRYTIYPSFIESFGLGLIEAIDCNTEVIASDLPYVDAVINPASRFNPEDPQSIAQAAYELLQSSSNQIRSEKKVKNEIGQLISLLVS